MLQPDLLASLRPINRLLYLDQELPTMSQLTPLGKVLHANYKTYLLDDLLVKTDRCTMSNSLEARAPFLDRDLVEYVAMLPDALKLDRGRYKVVLRDAFQDLLPQLFNNAEKWVSVCHSILGSGMTCKSLLTRCYCLVMRIIESTCVPRSYTT